jgi:hypothetical protein
MAIFKELSSDSVKSQRSYLNQLVDILGSDISGSQTRKEYQVFVTGGLGPGVTSSLFQTVFDQDFTLQTANSIFDVTLGVHKDSEVVIGASPSIDSNGKYLFPRETLMMREKMDIYRLMASQLLGDENAIFASQSGSNAYEIKEAMFFAFKRLFHRDQIKRETFALRLAPSGASVPTGTPNIAAPGVGSVIMTDINSNSNKAYTFGGQVSTVVDSANVANPLGVLFLDRGVFVLDLSRSLDQARAISGSISAVSTTGIAQLSASLKFMMMSASIDDFVDHVCGTRFSSLDQTAITFQNITNINSTLFFCTAGADEFNYSSNPTYLDSNNRMVVIDEGQEETQQSFTFVTSVGLYDANDNLLAVAKLSRPVYKDASREIPLKCRLDFVSKPKTRHMLNKKYTNSVWQKRSKRENV